MKRTLMGIAVSGLLFTACDPEEEMNPETPTGSISVSDQALEGNTISVDNITLNQSGWVVVHASNDAGDGPQVPEIISEPLLVEEGMNSDVQVTLTDADAIEDGDQVWVMLHTDDGEKGVYEFDGSNGFDGPITNDDGSVVVKPLTLTVEAPMPTGMLTVSDQTLSQNMVRVENVNLDQNGWIVVHASNEAGDGPQVPEIISEPLLVEAGEQSDLMISLSQGIDLSDGDQLWVMLHTDNGEAGVYEFDGSNGFDGPILDADDNVVVKPITISAPSVTASNQVVSENSVVIDQVNAAVDGWIVIHADNEGAPGEVLGQSFVEAGVNENISIDLGDAVFAGGEVLFPMLHIESPADGEYGFPDNGDGPEIFGENVVVVSMETTAPTGSITVEDQVVDANTITVSDLTVNATAWVVVHASNDAGDGPEVPAIISTPVQLEAGSTADVEIELTETVVGGDELYIMLHTENGTIGEYEFDGANGFDAPITTEMITINAPTGSITASDQIVQGNTITATNLTVDAAAWVVVHASNAAGDGPEVPGIISTPVKLEAGSNDNVEIELTETVAAEDVLYIMLHTENGTIGEYEFDGANGFDGPISTQSITVEAPTGSFTANDQTLTNGNVIVESITVGQPSWVVIHRDNGMGSFVAPGIISEPVSLEAGTSTDVEISFADGEDVADGETLWIMLHNDNGVVGTYEFDGANGLDNPITFSSIDVSTANAINYDVTNDGASAYLFTGDGLTDASNPDITLVRGETYTFTVNASGHPFYINETQGTGTANAYNDGVTNNGAQSGTITFTVPNNAPNTLFYNCEFHSSMTGTIAITD